MKSYKQFWLFFIPILFACKARYQVSRQLEQQYKIANIGQADSIGRIERYLKPYRDTLNKTMNEVIGYAAKEFKKDKDGGSLGKLLVSAMQDYQVDYKLIAGKKEMDGVLTNPGGIRLTQLPKGDITLGKIFELQPFENEMVLVYVKGSQLKLWMDLIKKGNGWPMGGRLLEHMYKQEYQSGQILSDTILRYEPTTWEETNSIRTFSWHPDSTYCIATSDYIANGGDNCEFLKNCPRINTGKLVRDVLIEYIRKKKVLDG